MTFDLSLLQALAGDLEGDDSDKQQEICLRTLKVCIHHTCKSMALLLRNSTPSFSLTLPLSLPPSLPPSLPLSFQFMLKEWAKELNARSMVVKRSYQVMVGGGGGWKGESEDVGMWKEHEKGDVGRRQLKHYHIVHTAGQAG